MTDFTTRLSLQKPVGGDAVSELRLAIRANADALDGAGLFSEGTLASRPVSTAGTPGIAGRRYLATDQAPAPGVEYLDYGTGWLAINAADQAAGVPSQRTLGTSAGQALPGNYAGLTKVTRQYHSFTTDDSTSPNAVSVVGSFFIDPASTETVKLIGAIIHCVQVGSTPSVFKVQTDHGAHGTLSNVPGLTALTPSTSTTSVVVSGGPMVLSAFDRVSLVVVTAGNSLGCTVQPVTEHSV